MQIRGMRAGDIEGYLEYQLEVFESLRGTLPPVFIEGEISWLYERWRAWVEGAIKDPRKGSTSWPRTGVPSLAWPRAW